ncbi:MAG: cell wall-binding repeat-containing protein [Euzebya sp.]
MVRLRCLLVVLVCLATACAGPPSVMTALPEAQGCPVLPPDSIWNTSIEDLPVHPRSVEWVASIGNDEPAHADFGSGIFDGGPIGIPYVVVPGDQERVPISFDFDQESDPGPYPIPANAPIEGGPDADGDRHILVVDADACVLYEVYQAYPDGSGGWTAGSGAIFDLNSNELRTDTWTSADAAGLPILPGLVRPEEVAAGHIDHALRVTAPRTDRSYVWPARHQAGATDDPTLPPMGARLRLSSSINPSDFPAQVQPIVVALQTYGAFLADNGSPWFISGVPDESWNNDDLRALADITGSDWEVVDSSGLQLAPDSGAARQSPGQATDPPLREGGRLSGPTRIDTAISISRAQFPDGAPTVYLASADVFVDAVAGGVLTDGPILLVPACGSLPDAVALEITRLDPGRVLALGGEAAICESMLDQARAA